MKFDLDTAKIGIIGLGYVGMPLALALARHFPVVGFDINKARVEELGDGQDRNREIETVVLRATQCKFTAEAGELKNCNVYIVTVPTPIDVQNNPDLTALQNASKTVAKILKKNDIVVFESTVYPGVTEDICGEVLEKESGLKSGLDFFLGYSPERINPGDTLHTVDNITKVVAGQNDDVADFLVHIYGLMNGGNIFKAKNIKTAEASKAIENAQRDINVAFVNEVTMVLNKMGLSAYDVLEAAKTKWNFLPFTPGLVGGHCIGVDPYYLAKSAQDIGHNTEVILAGRKINDSMGIYIADMMNSRLKSLGHKEGSDILVLGFTFKENINDIRNTKVIDTVRKLQEFGHKVYIHDPHASPEATKEEYGVDILSSIPTDMTFDCLALMVNHQAYAQMSASNIKWLLKAQQQPAPLVFDIKSAWRGLEFGTGVFYQTL